MKLEEIIKSIKDESLQYKWPGPDDKNYNYTLTPCCHVPVVTTRDLDTGAAVTWCSSCRKIYAIYCSSVEPCCEEGHSVDGNSSKED